MKTSVRPSFAMGFFLIRRQVLRCQLRIASSLRSRSFTDGTLRAPNCSALAGSSRRGRRGSRRRTRLRIRRATRGQVHSGVGKPWAFGQTGPSSNSDVRRWSCVASEPRLASGTAGLSQPGFAALAIRAHPTAHALLLRRFHPPRCRALTPTFFHHRQPYRIHPSFFQSIEISSYPSWVPRTI